ncbi:MAG: hypothetical protein CM15mP74_13380 [Halieaceae bacterium]|nr:MAG: hypothetical protein CM15mP74_13380 [Halieaceae bacterium]
MRCLQGAAEALKIGIEKFEHNQAGELLAEDLRSAHNQLGEITGKFEPMTYSAKFSPRSALASSPHRLHRPFPKKSWENLISATFVDCCVHTAVYKGKQRLTIKYRLIADQLSRSGFYPTPPSYQGFAVVFYRTLSLQ